MIIRLILLFLLMSGVSYSAFAGPVEIQSIQIVPTETTVGKPPEITGSIKANKVGARGGTINIIVIAAVVRPDNVMKSWSWKNITMRTGDIRSFTMPKDYDMKLAGTYKVDFSVYSKDMNPLHSLSKTFVATDPSLLPATTITPKDDRPRTETTALPTAVRSAEYKHIGVGIYSNTLNGTGGATMLLWPFKYMGVQGSYTVGSFTIAEGRVLARLPLSSGINPYLGAGYLNVTTERTVETINIKTRLQGSGVSGVIGAEIPLSKSVFGYAEISGASIDLKKEVSSGSISGIASVKYAPVTIGIGVVYFLF